MCPFVTRYKNDKEFFQYLPHENPPGKCIMFDYNKCHLKKKTNKLKTKMVLVNNSPAFLFAWYNAESANI